MTQHTYAPDDDGYDYRDLEVKDIEVQYHPSLMDCHHDYSCPVCRERHAVLSCGLMQPCWTCQEKGYRIVKKTFKKWWEIFRCEFK